MGQNKLKRFEELTTFSNVLQYPEDIQGKWNHYFNNKNPIILELACGKGEYAVGLGRLFSEKNFIGVDLKGNRLWVGAKQALKDSLQNVAFLRTQIDRIADHFAENEVEEIWITFPDPQLRTGKARKRLTHPKFLRKYLQFLKPGGLIHLKTDSPALYEFTKLVIEHFQCRLFEDYNDLHNTPGIPEILKIKTHYEMLDIAGSNRIHYLKFALPDPFPETLSDKEFQQIIRDHEAD